MAPTAQFIPYVAPTWVNSSGVPLAGGSIYSYIGGTSTPQATYTDETATTPNSNPVVLNSAGQAQIWLRTDLTYKIIVKDSLGNTISTTDLINIVNPGSIDLTKLNAASIVGVAMGVDAGNGKFDVLYDNVTIGVNGSNQLYVPTGGITPDKFAASSKLEVVVKNVRDLTCPGLIQQIPQYEWSSPTFLTNPTTLPAGAATCAKWSPNGEFLVVGSSVSTFLTFYQRANGILTALAAPATMPTGTVNAMTWSPCGDFLAIGCVASSTSNPSVIIYQRIANTFASVQTIIETGGVHKGTVDYIAFSPNSDFLIFEYLLLSGGLSGFKIYERAGTTFSDITSSSTLSGITGTFAWSSDSYMLAALDTTSNAIDVFSRADYVFTANITPPNVTAYEGEINDFSFSPDGNFLAVAINVTPYILIFQIQSYTFTQLSNPGTLPPGATSCVVWSENSEYLFVGDSSGTSPYMTIYQVTNPTTSPTFTKISNPGVLPAGGVVGASWSPTKQFLAVASAMTPFIQVYQTASTLQSDAFLWTREAPNV